MLTYDGTRVRVKAELIRWWCEQIAVRRTERGAHEEMHSIICDGDTIYSFGRHFPMAVVARDKKGDAVRVILNGDNGGARGWANTAGDQSQVRRDVHDVISGMSREIPVMIVPLSATDAAGIDRASITPIEVRPDRSTHFTDTSNERPGPFAKVESGRMVPTEIKGSGGYRHKETGKVILWHEHSDLPAERKDEYEWAGQVTVTRDRPEMVDDPMRASVKKSYAHGWPDDYAELQSDGTWKWEVRRHWLGDSLFRARTVERRQRKATKAERETFEAHAAWERVERTLREQYHDAQRQWAYANHAIKRSEKMRLVQDGPYVIPTDADVARLEYERDHADALHLDHLQSEPNRLDSLDIRRVGEHVTVYYSVRRWAYYLSSFDYNEPHSPYFLCELPATVHRDGQVHRPKPETVEEAIDWLRPNAVVQAERVGLNVLRQGDVFAIPTAYTTSELKSRAKLHTRTNWTAHIGDASNHETTAIRSKVKDGSAAQVLGTNHAPTHMIATEDGEFFGRGRLYHTPDGRDPDHRVVELGDRTTWYRLVKNTVPVSQGARTTIVANGGRVFRTQSRAWMLGGGVD